MRLIDLNPEFVGHGGEGVYRSDTGEPVPRTERAGIIFDCPCGNTDEDHRLFVPFANPIGPGPLISQQGWQRRGDDVETLTLTPSILRHTDCAWHGFITDGEVRTV